MDDGCGRSRLFLDQREVKPDRGVRFAEAGLPDGLRIGDPDHGRNQFLARAEGEVVKEILVALDVELGREVAVAWRLDEEMNVRRALAMTPNPVDQGLRRSVGGTAVAARHDRTETVPAVPVGLNAAAEVVSRLRRAEERVEAHRVGVPDIDDGARHGVAAGVLDLSFDENHLAVVGAVVKAGFAFRQRRAGNVERSFDGAGGAAGKSGPAFG